MTVGIQRIKVKNQVNGRGAWRFDVAKPYHEVINKIYRSLFNLVPVDEYLECTAEERLARYDIEFGVDVILNFMHGQSTTIQEKVLTTEFNTVTVEYYQDWRNEIEGDWFKLKCDFYFVGYANSSPHDLDRWILLDWNKVRMAGGKVPWRARENQNDGARANFRYAHFNSFPPDCVVAKLLEHKLITNTIPYGPEQYQLF